MLSCKKNLLYLSSFKGAREWLLIIDQIDKHGIEVDFAKSQSCLRSLIFPKVQTSYYQSEQKYSNVQIVIHSMLAKMVNPLCS